MDFEALKANCCLEVDMKMLFEALCRALEDHRRLLENQHSLLLVRLQQEQRTTLAFRHLVSFMRDKLHATN